MTHGHSSSVFSHSTHHLPQHFHAWQYQHCTKPGSASCMHGSRLYVLANNLEALVANARASASGDGIDRIGGRYDVADYSAWEPWHQRDPLSPPSDPAALERWQTEGDRTLPDEPSDDHIMRVRLATSPCPLKPPACHRPHKTHAPTARE